ncbi:MAG: neutral/alkaline non-lysosomal ceramidase N-terminal domain-containing protein [Bacteroidetes bacterium]|nr:neutral/alkaline non-lysosomal ceramidase N-terminal domain-containing protein [Fibrella sp.]
MSGPIRLVGLLTFLLTGVATSGQSQVWKAGVARTVITPKQSIWLGGYASRTHVSEGKLHELWAKALALEDGTGKRAVLVTTDLLGFPKAISDRIRDQLKQTEGLGRDQIILNSSHTHSGPVLENALMDVYPLNGEQQVQVSQYSQLLEKQIVELVRQAIKRLEPAQVFSGNGVTRFQVNRRSNKEASLLEQAALSGPNDFAVPVLKVLDRSGQVKAIAFGYACHPTVLDLYQWSGDYPGFAQLELEKAYPSATTLFFQGAAGDLNPLPRRTIPLARQYGRELAVAVQRVIDEPMQSLTPELKTGYTEIDLPLGPLPSETELKTLTSSTEAYVQRWATRMLAGRQRNEQVRLTYPYPVQLWQLGNQSLVSLGGEVVVEYALSLKQRLGRGVFVMGYSNDVMGYIPSETVLREGGYEGNSSQMVYGQPSQWAPGLQARILSAVDTLVSQLMSVSPK